MLWGCVRGGGRRCRFGNPRSVTITMRSARPLNHQTNYTQKHLAVMSPRSQHRRRSITRDDLALSEAKRSRVLANSNEHRSQTPYTETQGGTPRTILFLLKFKHYTSTKPFTISVIVVMGDTKTPPLLKMERGQTLLFFKINSYLVAYHWKGRFNTKVMPLRNGLYDIPG